MYVGHAQRLWDMVVHTIRQTAEHGEEIEGSIGIVHDAYVKVQSLNPGRLDRAGQPRCRKHPTAGVTEHYGRYSLAGRYFKCVACEEPAEEGFDVILVDEAQDMTPAQARIFWGCDNFDIFWGLSLSRIPPALHRPAPAVCCVLLDVVPRLGTGC